MRVHSLILDKNINNIEVLPLSDLHVGDASFDRECFLRYIRYVEDSPNRYILLNGDILNNATKSSVSDIYEETLNPRDQIKETAIMLHPVRERILGIVSGNHERRTDKEVGISPVEMLADKLDVPYFGIEVLLKFKFGLSKRKKDRQLYYTLYATHGWGGGRTRGAKVNNLERLSHIVLCDIYCMAHVHAQVSFPSMIYTPERQCDSVVERTMWFVNSGSFLKRGSGYAAAKGYPPTVMGCPVIELSGTEHKVVVTMGEDIGVMVDIKLMQGDCLEKMKDIPDGSIDLTVTSPPYDNLRNYNGNIELWCEHVWKAAIKDLYRVTKDGGVVVWVVGDATIKGSETGTPFSQALFFKECGFNLHDTMIYRKANYIPLTHKRYEQEFEYMFIFSKGKPNTFNPIMVDCKTAGSSTKGRTFYQTNNQNFPTKAHTDNAVSKQKQKGNVWDLSTNAGAKGHPAQFPEQLALDHIISWSNEGDTVLDPFMGSGTTGKMAKLLNRNFIGIELDPEYFEIARSRIEQAHKAKEVEPYIQNALRKARGETE